MGLQKYHAKRNFDKTPEPKGAERKSSKELEFVVQEHQASQHHYDFRLEVDGVLKSWAIPKGPSMNPRDHHLAVITEDHPFEYRKFEGVIPEGNYGAGEVIIWDSGTYQPLNNGGEKEMLEGLKKGHITFYLFGQKLQGEFALIKLQNSKDNDAWLMVKKGDTQATTKDILKKNESVVSGKTVKQLARDQAKNAPKKSMPKNVKPMLCTLVDDPFDGDDWIFEIKWDGYRAIATKNKTHIELYSRNGNDFSQKYTRITEAILSLKDDVVLDGEIVVVDKTGHAHFEWMQNWSSKSEGTLYYYAFDILWLNGKDLTSLPLIERKQILQKTIKASAVLRYSDHIEKQGKQLFKQAQKSHLEGIVAKKINSKYQQNVRGGNWLKIKTHLRQEAVIGGYTEPMGSREYFGALLLGVYEKGKFVHIGSSGGGFEQSVLKKLYEQLKKLEIKHSPFTTEPVAKSKIHWVEPRLVCEVSFAEWTSGGTMRHPSFEGMRDDKKPNQVHREKPKG
ncbi:MAG TPA: non-homologous end-joining DNA ligase [Candidatus Saccharimonadales bacterium]|nr:non-homologous end-joining DNA ligase [Candidatus Saccharimonadales bacterium]